MWEPLLAGQRRTRRLLLATHQQAALSPCLTKSRNYLSHMADDNSESCGDQPREPNDFCSSGMPSRCRWFLNWVGMSATGHKRKWCPAGLSCPFFPSKQTFVSGGGTSAMCQKQSFGRTA